MESPAAPLVHRQRTLVTSLREAANLDTPRYTVCGLVIDARLVAVVGRGEAAGRHLCPVCWPRRS